MLRHTLAGATALSLLSVPALGQEAAPGGAGAVESAIQSAQSAGMQDVRSLEGATVLEGSTEAGRRVLMIVGPAGELLALASPMMQQEFGTAPPGEQAEVEPGPGEPAESGYMATQVDPAMPSMWDPISVQAAMRSLELGLRGAAGQVSEPAVNQQ